MWLSTPTQPETAVVRDDDGKLVMEMAQAGHHEAGGRGLGSAGADHGEGARRQDRSVRLSVQADELRCGEEISDREPCLSRAADGIVRWARLCRGAWTWQSLAELGFVVVCIDGMGTPWRSKSFHERYYGDLGDNTIPDQVAG
jgi:dipeptidyl-peptidase-4